MLSNIRILPEELPPAKAMEQLTQRRIPFAITINAQNEVHRSITLNILHGTPQGKDPAEIFISFFAVCHHGIARLYLYF